MRFAISLLLRERTDGTGPVTGGTRYVQPQENHHFEKWTVPRIGFGAACLSNHWSEQRRRVHGMDRGRCPSGLRAIRAVSLWTIENEAVLRWHAREDRLRRNRNGQP